MKKKNRHMDFLQEEAMANLGQAAISYPGVKDIVNWRGDGGIPYVLKHDDLDTIAKMIAGEDGTKGAAVKVTEDTLEDEDDLHLFEYGDIEDTEYEDGEDLDADDEEIGVKVKDDDTGEEDVSVDVPVGDEDAEVSAEDEDELEDEDAEDAEIDLEDLEDENEDSVPDVDELEAGEEDAEDLEDVEDDDELEDAAEEAEEDNELDDDDLKEGSSPLSLLEGTDESEALSMLLKEMDTEISNILNEDAFLDEEVVVDDETDTKNTKKLKVSRDKVEAVAESAVEKNLRTVITETFYGKI